jgi:hypothetical protein
MSILINQEALIYSEELTYSMRCFNQAGAYALATSQYYKKQFWAGQFLVERQTYIKMNHNTISG